MKNLSKVIRGLFNLDYAAAQKYIAENFSDVLYDCFIAQKGLEKIYRNEHFTEEEKNGLIVSLQEAMPRHYNELENTYSFVQAFIPIANLIVENIEKTIIESFNNSLANFYYCLGRYVYDNPYIIGTAKGVLVNAAKRCLANDLELINYNLTISLENVYVKNVRCLEYLYKEAIKYGVILEKYDTISFGVEYIDAIAVDDSGVRLSLKLVDADFEYGLHCGEQVHNVTVKRRFQEEPGVIEAFYKCKICQYASLCCANETDKELAFSVLRRQFSNRNQTDLFYFFTGDLQSYILSIIAYIYTRFLILFFCTDETMCLVSKKEIREKMLWSERISNEEFEECFSLILSNKNTLTLADAHGQNVVVGRWQYDNDFSIIELAKAVSLNAKDSKRVAENANAFGKDIYERLVRDLLSEEGWDVIPISIKVKGNKKGAAKSNTDIDLIAYKEGIALIGQVKLANSGRSRYDLWKARNTISKAVEQVDLSMIKLERDKNLLFSILRKFGFCENKNEIKKILPVVITSSSYFIGAFKDTGIPIVSWDIFCQIIRSLNHFNNLSDIEGYFSDVCALYDFGYSKEIVISRIEQPEFEIDYEEYEEWC